ncbi:L-lactate dehydrogenase [Mycoplasmoides pirum]|uniref:L-lactate dehydrogenase n=1 Tax=Mycoplasmoides pirum TaxID=2122 RepID=UPI000480A4CB|nr:L-lactate dehydrogenase [Mycoplasmoides pirum]
MKKINVISIGAGAVGNSFLYSAINQGLVGNYGIIDVNTKVRDGNVLDFEDAAWTNQRSFNIYSAKYSDLKNADFVIVSAGRPQKPGETRLQLVEGNVAIMRDIAKEVKASGFKGIAIIVSNPLDVMTYAFWKYSGLSKNRVIGSGTTLDTARLRHFIGTKAGISPKAVQAYVLGEHGDSSVVAYSQIKIEGIPLKKLEKIHKINDSNYEKLLEEPVRRKAYEIINRKGATFYGIGNCVAGILRSILDDSNEVLPVSTYLNGEYGASDVFTGVPSILTRDGVKGVLEIELNAKEKKKLQESIKILKTYIKKYVK